MQRQEELEVQFGKYRVFAKLAVGGMAELFLARQPGIGGFQKTVVLKCILPHLAQDDDFLQMFLDEARIASPLNHPNIVQIFEIGEEVGVYFIVMEYIRGHNLREFRQRLYKHHADVKPYNLCAGILAQVAAGLHYAHTALDDNGIPLRIVHRDISPTNLLLSYNGIVKVVDFGVAKATSQQHQTSAGTIKGKYRYMSPEQIRGHELDQRSDVFSLGIVLYELSTNVGLFGRRHEAEVIDAVRNARVTPPRQFRPDYPEELERICLKALSLDPNDRYQNADGMRADLEAFMREDSLYYGPAQLSELVQFLFAAEQKQSHTAAHLLPLSPADFVRFLGEVPGVPGSRSGVTPSPGQAFPSQDGTSGIVSGQSSSPNMDDSVQALELPAQQSQVERTPSGGWASPSSPSHLKTPTSGQHVRNASGITASPQGPIVPPPLPNVSSPPSNISSPPSPSGVSPAGVSSPGISSPGLSSPSRTRDEVLEDSGLLKLPTSAFDTFEVNESGWTQSVEEAALSMEEDSPTEIYPSNEFAEPGDTNPSMPALQMDPLADDSLHDDPIILPRQRNRFRPLFLMVGILLGGLLGAYALGLFSQVSEKDLLLQKTAIQQDITAERYGKASQRLAAFRELVLPPAYSEWAEVTAKELKLLPLLKKAKLLYEKQEYKASLQILRGLLRQAPDNKKVRAWIDKVELALQQQKNALAMNRPKPPERRGDDDEGDDPDDDPPPVRRRRRRRIRRRARRRTRRRVRRRRRRRVAMLPRRKVPAPVTQEGYLYVMSSPQAQASVNGRSEETPWRVLLPVGRYKLRLVRKGFKPVTKWVSVLASKTSQVRVVMKEIRRAIPRPRPIRRPEPVRKVRLLPPPPRRKTVKFSVRLPRKKSLRVFISDPRGIGGLQYTSDLKRYSRGIERQVGAILGQGRVRGITKAWQRYVRSRATKANQAYFDFYPRAVAYVIFYQLRRGRSASRVSQILVKYERFKRFKRFKNK